MDLKLQMPIITRYNPRGGWDLSNIKIPWYRQAASWVLQTLVLALLLGSCYVFSVNGGCGAGKRGVEALKSDGLRDVDLGYPAWYRCPKGEVFGSYFTATNVEGRQVEGLVCCGFTSCMVRW